MVPDIGLLASSDPVAIDQASGDLVKQGPGFRKYEDVSRRFRPIDGEDSDVTLAYAEELGLGRRKYSLEEI